MFRRNAQTEVETYNHTRVNKWILIVLGMSTLPLLLSIGIAVIADFGFKNIKIAQIIPDFLLIIFAVSINLVDLGMGYAKQRYRDKMQLYMMIALFTGVMSCAIYYGLFSINNSDKEYPTGTFVVLALLSISMYAVNAFFGVKMSKMENSNDENKE